MKHFFMSILATTVCLLSSCIDSQIEDMKENALNGVDATADRIDGTYRFSYQGKDYESDYLRTDSLVFFVDKDVAYLWNLLKEKPHLATYVDIDGNIEYFDDESKLAQSLSEKESTLMTRSWGQYPSMTQAYLQYWKDYNYTDDSQSYVINAQNGWKTEVSNFVKIGFNDKVSSYLISASFIFTDYSLRATTAVVTFYSDINFGGYSLKSTASSVKNEFRVFNLEDVFMPTGRNWNDAISSMKFEAVLI